jgi:pimeloyl-ACP methyl ester carboxylesterase
MVSAVAAMQRRYRELRMPVVIMAGTMDRIVDHRKHAVRLHQEIAHSALRLVPGVGHMLHYAVPEQVVDAIEASFNNPTTPRSAAGKVELPQSASLEIFASGP